MARSINQNANTGVFPDFRNVGIALRILLLANAGLAVASLLQAGTLREALDRFTVNAALMEPLLLVSLVLLALLSPLLPTLGRRAGVILILVLELLLTSVTYVTSRSWFSPEGLPGDTLPRWLLICAAATAAMLMYFDLRARALSPAIAESRLQALQARIRPHFLFNSINAVLSLVREHPRRAETALEDMAGLFRALMADNRELAPLSQELELCRQYLGLEQLRLGERLQVEWHVDKMPADALIPPLALQPLLENAVYHGIEPREVPGVISINIFAVRDRLQIVLRNPYRLEGDHHSGNKMAVGNIRERLQLHFDAAAELTTRVGADSYEVRMTMPYIRSGAA